MNAADSLRLEIEKTPDEEILRETYDFLMFLKTREAPQLSANSQASPAPKNPTWPDFIGRLKAIYGGRMGNDSQEIMDHLREERS